MLQPIPLLGQTIEESKARLFEILGYRIHAEPVRQAHLSTARYLVLRAPARTSKSYSAAPEAVHSFLPWVDPVAKKPVHEEQVIWAVGVNYDSSTLKEWEYIWAYLSRNDFELVRALGGTVTQKYNSPNSGNLRVVAEWGPCTNGRTARTVITGKSSSNEISLQGEEVFDCILSEAAEHDERVFRKYLETRCQRIIFPTTPKRKALWLYELTQRGLDDPKLGVEEIFYTRECNPTYDMGRYEAAKARSAATYGDCANDPEFMEQFEGEWVFHEGKVLPFRWLDTGNLRSHVVSESDPRWPEIKDWIPYADHVVSLDYGYTDPAVAHFTAIGPHGQMLQYDEIHAKLLSHQEFVDRCRAKEREHGIEVALWVPDPQRPEITKLLRHAGLPIFTGLTSAIHRDRASSSMALVDLLSTDPAVGSPRLLIHARCQQTIREWKQLRRKEEVSDQWGSAALVGRDDHFDAARYFAKACIRYKASKRLADEQWLDTHYKSMRLRHAREASLRRWGGVSQARL